MATLMDGLGGEEIVYSGLGLATQSPYFTGSVTSASQISGLNVFATGSVTAGRLTTANGALHSASMGSPASYGAFVQAGVVGPVGNSSGLITFGRSFANTSYAIAITALGSFTAQPYAFSGTTLFTTSGCVFGGQSGTNANYAYVAVGL